MITGKPVVINGDGENSRDFCFIDNAVQANILAATAPEAVANQVYNVAIGERTSLNQLFELIRTRLETQYPQLINLKAIHQDFRAGDIKHSQADISKAKNLLGYEPSHRINEGLDIALQWYIKNIIN